MIMKNLVYWFCVLTPFVLVRHYYGERLRQEMELPNQAMLHQASRDLAAEQYTMTEALREPALVQKHDAGEETEEEEDKRSSLRGSRNGSAEEPNVEPNEPLGETSKNESPQEKAREDEAATLAEDSTKEESGASQLDESERTEVETA